MKEGCPSSRTSEPVCSAWTAGTVIDLSVAPVIGDKSAETTIGIAGLKSTDAVENVFASDVVGRVQFGAAFEKGAASISVNARYSF